MILSITLFFVIALGMGYTVLSLCKIDPEDSLLEYLFQILVVGFAIFSFLAVPLNILHIPLHISVYIILALIYPVYKIQDISVMLNSRKKIFKRINWFAVIILLLFVIHTSVYIFGATRYPYLEDDDPWAHASASKYVATYLTYSLKDNARFSSYLEPYPPTYDVIMGIMHQSNQSINLTLKVFNAIMVSLSLIFFYLFAKILINNRWYAMFSTIVLAVIPGFMSHFIWSHTLAVTLMIAALYATIQAALDKKWMIPAIIVIGSMMVSHQFVSVLFGLFYIFILLMYFINKKYTFTKRVFKVGFFGVALGMVFWIEQFIKYGMQVITMRSGEFQAGQGWMSAYALQKYTLKMLVFPNPFPRIDQATGIGLIVFVLAIIGLFVTIYNWRSLSNQFIILLTVFTTYYLFSAHWIPIPGVSRAWVFISIPIALLSGKALCVVQARFTKTLGIIIVICLIATMIYNPGFKYKYDAQTGPWAPGAMWKSVEELQGYMSLTQLPPNSRVLPLCKNNDLAVGMDMDNDYWDIKEREFLLSLPNQSVQGVNAYMRSRNYEYVIGDVSCLEFIGYNESNYILGGLAQTNEVVLSNQNFYLWRVI